MDHSLQSLDESCRKIAIEFVQESRLFCWLLWALFGYAGIFVVAYLIPGMDLNSSWESIGTVARIFVISMPPLLSLLGFGIGNTLLLSAKLKERMLVQKLLTAEMILNNLEQLAYKLDQLSESLEK